MALDSTDWPHCQKCGGIVWKINCIPHITGFEDQFFTCLGCGTVTARQVVMSDEELEAHKAGRGSHQFAHASALYRGIEGQSR